MSQLVFWREELFGMDKHVKRLLFRPLSFIVLHMPSYDLAKATKPYNLTLVASPSVYSKPKMEQNWSSTPAPLRSQNTGAIE